MNIKNKHFQAEIYADEFHPQSIWKIGNENGMIHAPILNPNGVKLREGLHPIISISDLIFSEYLDGKLDLIEELKHITGASEIELCAQGILVFK